MCQRLPCLCSRCSPQRKGFRGASVRVAIKKELFSQRGEHKQPPERGERKLWGKTLLSRKLQCSGTTDKAVLTPSLLWGMSYLEGSLL